VTRAEPLKDGDGESPALFLLAMRMASALARSWKLLVLGGMAVLAVSAGLILLMPQSYEAKATVLFTESRTTPGGGALSLLKDAGLGNLLGESGANLDQASTLLASDALAFWGYRKYRLDTAWRDTTKPDTLRPEDIVRNWGHSIKAEIDEKNALQITYTSKSPVLSAMIVEGICGWLDSMTLAIHLAQSKQNLAFVEEQLVLQTKAFDSAQSALLAYQKKNRILSMPDQVQASVEGSAKLEAEAMMADIQARTASTTGGTESSEYKRLVAYRDQLRQQAKRILGDPNSAGAFHGFDELGKLAEIARLQREVLGRKTVYTLLAQQREQLLLESRKSLPTLLVLDHPYVPTKRSSPPRRILFYLVFVAWSIGCSTWIIGRDALNRMKWRPEEKSILREIATALPLPRFLRNRILGLAAEE
jgi:uncharacterized protein involved in exopolysaccharide biosynthesis